MHDRSKTGCRVFGTALTLHPGRPGQCSYDRTAVALRCLRPATIAEMPAPLPVFPLQGALLLPGTRLPLNIFEPRYLAMIDDALAGHRTIGMIQPKVPEQTVASDHPPLHGTWAAPAASSRSRKPATGAI